MLANEKEAWLQRQWREWREIGESLEDDYKREKRFPSRIQTAFNLASIGSMVVGSLLTAYASTKFPAYKEVVLACGIYLSGVSTCTLFNLAHSKGESFKKHLSEAVSKHKFMNFVAPGLLVAAMAVDLHRKEAAVVNCAQTFAPKL